MIDMIPDILIDALITSLILAPVASRYNQWKGDREYSRRLKKYGGWTVHVVKREKTTIKTIGSESLSVDEAEMLCRTLLKPREHSTLGAYVDVSTTENRRLLQSIISGFREQTDNVLTRTTFNLNERKFIITL